MCKLVCKERSNHAFSGQRQNEKEHENLHAMGRMLYCTRAVDHQRGITFTAIIGGRPSSKSPLLVLS